jgi:hypothetical protein
VNTEIMNTPMQYNQCNTCGAGEGRAGALINGDCKNCYNTRQSGVAVVYADLQRTQGELAKTFNIIAKQIMKKYAISSNNEDWDSECYATREEAIQAGLVEYSGESFWIGEARPPEPPENFFNAHAWIEEVGEHEDYSWRDYPYTMSMAKLDDLDDLVHQAIKKFLADNNLQPTHFVVENNEKIDPEKL